MNKSKASFLIWIILLSWILSACALDPANSSTPSANTPSGEEPAPTVDYGVDLSDNDGWAVRFTGTARGVLVDDGYYYIEDGFLRYLDMNSGISVYLCSDLLCEHKDESLCEAGIMDPMTPMLIFFADDSLYYVEMDGYGASVVMRRNAAGMALEKVARLGESFMGKDKSVSVGQFMLADNWLYYQMSVDAITMTEYGSEVKAEKQVLCRLNLKTGKDEVLVEFDGGSLGLVSVKEDAMLYQLVDMPEAEPLYDEDGFPYLPQEYYDQLPDSPSRLMCWNQKTGESTVLLEKRNFDMKSLKCYGGKVIYYNSAADERYGYDLKTGEVAKMELITGTIINEDYMLHTKDGMQSILNLKTGKTYPISMQGQSFSVYNRSENWVIFAAKQGNDRICYYIPMAALADGIQAEEATRFPE